MSIAEQITDKGKELEMYAGIKATTAESVKLCEIQIAELENQIEQLKEERDKWQSEYDEAASKYDALDDEIDALEDGRAA